MSLTSFLNKNSDVREQFKQEFQKPPLQVKKELLAPPLTKRYSTVGTAFDYLPLNRTHVSLSLALPKAFASWVILCSRRLRLGCLLNCR
jgi:hypothetical protein